MHRILCEHARSALHAWKAEYQVWADEGSDAVRSIQMDNARWQAELAVQQAHVHELKSLAVRLMGQRLDSLRRSELAERLRCWRQQQQRTKLITIEAVSCVSLQADGLRVVGLIMSWVQQSLVRRLVSTWHLGHCSESREMLSCRCEGLEEEMLQLEVAMSDEMASQVLHLLNLFCSVNEQSSVHNLICPFIHYSSLINSDSFIHDYRFVMY